MGIQNPKFPCVFLIIILMISQFSSCRHINRFITSTEEAKKTAKTTKLYSRFSWHSSAQPPEESRGHQIDPRYGASLRAVPGGPNPLHN
ncbi:hypothetical protein L484_024321 [Morus notabilis]|uniref:Uncharacterized protein n=1 Tax=Morus notabilis TaxID=981085 RepID=W9QSB7_9ROSA|nr:hypothetical protein L484_024321 [Morus notabilis]